MMLSGFLNQLNSYSGVISVFVTSVLVIVTIAYAKFTKDILEQSKTDTKIAYIKDRIENYYMPLSSFFDMCETDEHFNSNPDDPPTKISFDSSILEVFRETHKYQYLACPVLKSKLSDFVLMLLN